MTTRDHAPAGVPCWADLWTSDVEGSRKFYAGLFGWTAEEPDPNFGGYFLFSRDGLPVAGAMGDMGDMKANDTWKIYLATGDVATTVKNAEAHGGQIPFPPMPVGDLGIQALVVDPTGALVGAWQPGTFHGFSVIEEPGAPSWFELHTRDHDAAVDFYRSVFGWKTEQVSDTDEFRYTVLRNPEGDNQSAGIMDASSFLAPGQEPYWTVYWYAENATDTVERVQKLGGSVIAPAEDTPYGIVATVADQAGAQFRLHQPTN